MVMSHLGRPTEGQPEARFSLAPVAARLEELLGRPVPLASDWIDGVDVAPGDVVLCENVRFRRRKSVGRGLVAQNGGALRRVRDGCIRHRPPGPGEYLRRGAIRTPAVAGPLLAAELDALGKALTNRATGRCDRRRLESFNQVVGSDCAREAGRLSDCRRRYRQYFHRGGGACCRKVSA